MRQGFNEGGAWHPNADGCRVMAALSGELAPRSAGAGTTRELLDRRRLRTQAEARVALFRYIEGWYNPHRRPSALGLHSPMVYERLMLEAA